MICARVLKRREWILNQPTSVAGGGGINRKQWQRSPSRINVLGTVSISVGFAVGMLLFFSLPKILCMLLCCLWLKTPSVHRVKMNTSSSKCQFHFSLPQLYNDCMEKCSHYTVVSKELKRDVELWYCLLSLGKTNITFCLVTFTSWEPFLHAYTLRAKRLITHSLALCSYLFKTSSSHMVWGIWSELGLQHARWRLYSIVLCMSIQK